MKYVVGFLIVEGIVCGVLGLITLLTVRSWLFWLIQVVSANLFIPGLLVCAFAPWHLVDGKGHWPAWAWLFDNQEDGIFGAGPQTRRQAIYWAGLRNYVNNLRYVRGVSKVGRPLWYRTWTLTAPTFHWGWPLITWSEREFYAKAGWLSDGYPALSAGAGKGF